LNELNQLTPATAKVCSGSRATEPSGLQRIPMSVMPPTATKQLQRRDWTRWANRRPSRNYNAAESIHCFAAGALGRPLLVEVVRAVRRRTPNAARGRVMEAHFAPICEAIAYFIKAAT
jgi:hypothetical protein